MRPALVSGVIPAQELLLEVVGAHFRCVDHVVRSCAERAQHVGLARDSDLGAFIRGERMAAAGLGEAAKEHILAAVEVEDFRRQVRPPGETADEVENAVGGELAVSGVDPERDRARQRRAVEEPGKKREREVVDGLEPEVFEHLDGGAPARAGGAGDEHQPLRLRGSRVGHDHAPRPPARYCRTAAVKWGLATL